jgi:hypothetical protein
MGSGSNTGDWKMSLHEPTFLDLQQAVDVLRARESEYLAEIRVLSSELAIKGISEFALRTQISRLETELAEARAKGTT